MKSSVFTKSYLYLKAKIRELVAWIPDYAILPLMAMLLLNMVTYFGTRKITDHLYHFNISTKFDLSLPLIPVFVLPYILAYVQWIVGYIMISKESKEHCYYILTAEMIAKALIAVTFIIFPTTLRRPIIETNDVFTALTALVYKADAANNLFPSIHCLESMFCLYGSMKMTKVSSAYKRAMFAMTVLVVLSTLFIKQHVIWDAIGAFVYMGVGLLISQHIFEEK